MDKYHMFDALQYYQNNLQHVKSKLLGSKQEDTKYYARIGDPGKYRYFYTKAEWDAYQREQEGKKQDEWKKKKQAEEEAKKKSANQSGSAKAAEDEAKKRAEWERQQAEKKAAEESLKNKQEEIKKSAERNEYYEKQRQGEEGRKLEEKKRYDRLRQENNPRGTYASEQAKREGKEYQKWLDEQAKKKEERKKIDEGLAKIHEEAQNNIKMYQEKAEALEKAREEYNKNASEYGKKIEEEKRAEEARLKEMREKEKAAKKQFKDNSDYMKNDKNSPVNKMTDIINDMNNESKIMEMFYDGTLMSQLYKNDAVIDDIYQQIEDWKETEEIDPETGFRIKNYELPIEDEIKLVNPGYYYSDQVGMIGENGDYSMNCYACTQAMALRMKGYDTTAGTDSDGVSVEYSESWPSGKVDWKDPDYNAKDPDLGVSYNSLWSGNFSETKIFEQTLSDMKNEPPGSYGDFNMEIFMDAGADGKFGTGDDGSFGHSIFYQVDNNGKLHFYDCQSGQEFSEEKMKSFADYATIDNNGDRAYYTAYKRLDNQEYQGNKLKTTGKVSNNPEGGLSDEIKQSKSR